ncbi:hypothetical protein M409DRAFT_24829 [Zasmidium cellare ATCC 36951]|uniref:Uncharacterized protein n=1 Tax=Zasmidium cellare ATCC 36951 TaxID=1080233 RepID=A0A6A6CCK6_ZASCE|nr:uncharacterized protein M409DRAFT_24829 [Zasmidium cellare ATCC 36951]KAF2164927.1 hypothetical protein M409DRAFT_24829 [Zasmidium cellare ATCC 36951]
MATSHDVNIRWIEQLVATPEHERFSNDDAFHPLTHQPSPTDHVLRGSRSFAARSFRSRPSTTSLRVPSNRSNNENLSATAFEDSRPSLTVNPPPVGRVLGEIPPNGQLLRQGPFKTGRSPTPSLKKKKAEAIVKAHGSPTHVRVTAGGRIVPSDQSPLCHPRYGYSAVKTNGGLIKFAPNYPAKPQWTHATENGFVAQDQQGNLCQIVNGTILPLTEVDGALRLHMPAPNLNVTQRGSSLGPIGAPFAQNGTQPIAPSNLNPATAPEPSAESQITALELEYTKLAHELKDVDKTEVIHGRTMGRVAKDALIAKRRELVMNMDKVRKAIKGLKSQPPPNAPTSPRAMLNRQSVSPPRNRLPPFLQKQQPDNNAVQAPFGGFGTGPPAVFGGQYVNQPPPSPEETYAAHPWAMPPAGMFVPPAPFDGGMAPPFALFPQSAQLGAVGDQLPPRVDEGIPQNDGARSMADIQIGSPHQSHAVAIRAPATKPANNLKSSLNPMSPAYKPGVPSVRDRVPTPLSPLRQLQPLVQSQKASTSTNETISPAKKSTHMQSSSVSSFETADFFPRNTREFSLRPDPSDGKENNDPELPATGPNVSPATPHSQQQSNYRAPAPPPGTPVYQNKAIIKEPTLQSNLQGPRIEIPNRSTHNVSPKSKREWLFIQEHPDAVAQLPSSSPEKTVAHADETATGAGARTSNVSREWSEGFEAAMQRRPIGNRGGDSLQGYVAGLLRLSSMEPSAGEKNTTGPSTGSPLSRRPSPAVTNQAQMIEIEKVAPSPRPPFETASQSMDTLKQAVFAPHNENAVLTPAIDGPHVNEGSYNLGAWAKKMEAFPFPERSSTAVNQNDINNSAKAHPGTARSVVDSGHASETTSNVSIPSGKVPITANRISSMTSIDSSMWPKSRIMTPSEWKTGTIGIAAGVATGYFANAQFDGTNDVQRFLRMPGQYTDAVSITGANQSQRVTSITSNNPGRFREGSLDGLSNPPASPSQAISPVITPRDTPVKESPSKRKESTPVKNPSPAKAKFEHMAEKVGIKVASTGKSSNTTNPEPVSPTGKTGRRWRDVWKRGGRDTEE